VGGGEVDHQSDGGTLVGRPLDSEPPGGTLLLIPHPGDPHAWEQVAGRDGLLPGPGAPLLVENTLGRRLERFEPFQPPRVRMYVCGPTPYDYTHIGHARVFVAFDGIKRYLSLRGYDVFHIQNITDIDDKIINRARDEGVSWREIADRYTRDYLSNLEALGISTRGSPTIYTR